MVSSVSLVFGRLLSRLLLGLLVSLVLVPGVRGQAPEDTLRARVITLDHALFSAFNEGDLEVVMGFFDADLEFFHDQDGLLRRDEVEEGFRSLFARDDGLRRDLVPESTQVYPVPGYGAIQIGDHRFCHDENGRQDCGVFGFTHLWRNTDGRWRITRVLSYAH